MRPRAPFSALVLGDRPPLPGTLGGPGADASGASFEPFGSPWDPLSGHHLGWGFMPNHVEKWSHIEITSQSRQSVSRSVGRSVSRSVGRSVSDCTARAIPQPQTCNWNRWFPQGFAVVRVHTQDLVLMMYQRICIYGTALPAPPPPLPPQWSWVRQVPPPPPVVVVLWLGCGGLGLV